MKKHIQTILQSVLHADMATRKELKQLQTRQYLSSQRAYGQPATPTGFKPRSKASYFFTNY